MRKLVTIRTVKDLIPIDGADFIQIAHVDGWKCVVSKEHFTEVGQKGLYFEIDSFLPQTDSRFDFLEKGMKVRTFNNTKGYKLKTKRFKGELSQGLMLPLSMFPEIVEKGEAHWVEHDIAEFLGVQKWEMEQGHGSAPALGSLPYFFNRTEQERIQNVYDALVESDAIEVEYVPTMKVDGTSTTLFYVNNEDFFKKASSFEQGYEIGLCSHNVHLDDQYEDSIYFKGVKNSNWFDVLTEWCERTGRQVALQGETVGNKIQKNREGFNTYKTFLFDVYDIDKQRYFTVEEFREFVAETGLEAVPEMSAPIKVLKNSLEDILKMSDGAGINCDMREGFVWKSVGTDKQYSFKAISNEWLLKK